jgi:hypothetical protein
MIAPVVASSVPDDVALLAFAVGTASAQQEQRLVHINPRAGKSTLDSASGCV